MKIRDALDLKDDDDRTFCASCKASAVGDGPYCASCKDYWENDASFHWEVGETMKALGRECGE